jgi:hypothetical protein
MKVLYLSAEYPAETVTGVRGTYTPNISQGLTLLGHNIYVPVCAPGSAGADAPMAKASGALGEPPVRDEPEKRNGAVASVSQVRANKR